MTNTKPPPIDYTTLTYHHYMQQSYTARLASSCTWNLAPKDLISYSQHTHQLWFKFDFKFRPLSFEQHRASASFSPAENVKQPASKN